MKNTMLKIYLKVFLFISIIGFTSNGLFGGEIKDMIIIDVRSALEFNSGHLKGAINIPYDKIADKIEEVTKDKNKKIILYCRSSRRSAIAKSTLEKAGYKNVENAGTLDDIRKRFPEGIVK